MKIAIVTANFGGYDHVHPVPKQYGVEYEVFKFDELSTPFPLSVFYDRMKAKYFKCQTHKILPKFDAYLWIDGRVQIKSETTANFFSSVLDTHDIAIGNHNDRSCIYEEAKFIAQSTSQYVLNRYLGAPIMKEADYYREQGYPSDNGLFSCGVFIRKNNKTMNAVFDQWWESCLRWSHYDQFSLPFLLWKHKADVVNLPYGNIVNNDFFNLNTHKNKPMIFRDDDINRLTKMEEFVPVDELLKQYHVKHTIACICKDLDKNTALVDYINANPHIDVQVHAWEHIELNKNLDILKDHLLMCIKMIKNLFGKTPTILYPPWNLRDATTHEIQQVSQIAIECGLVLSYHKVSCNQYVKRKGLVDEQVINFHYWAFEDTHLLDPALRIHSELLLKKK